MSLTWAQLLSDLRTDMKDTGATPKLSTDTAFLYLKFALYDYSRFNPYISSEVLDVNTSGVASLPSSLIKIIEVRDPSDNELINPLQGYSNPPGGTLPDSYRRWWVEGNTLRFNTWGDDPDTVRVLCAYLHSAPAAASATGYTFTFPDADERAILLHIRASDMNTARSRTAKLDRFKTRVQAGNTRTDNPILPEENNLMDEFYAIMYEKYSSGSVKLTRRLR